MRSFGRFEVVREIGRGNCAVVLEAVDPTTRRRVALKVMQGGERATLDQEERLRREAEALGRVTHPNVVKVHESGAVDGVLYIVLEPIEGRPLSQLEGQAALDALEQAARGLEAVHRAGIVHRDLKPEHVLVDGEGRARVIDFGLARVPGASLALTGSGEMVGTPRYMAPEVARGDHDAVGPWSDVWSLGAMLLELLTGQPPYPQAKGLVELGALLANPHDPPRARTRRAEIDPRLDDVCARALRKPPQERYASAGAFADALATACGRGGPDLDSPSEPRTAVRIALTIVALSLAGLLALAAWLASGPMAPGPVSGAVTSSAATSSAHAGEPAWWAAFPPAQRPPLPLPRGLAFGAAPGEYRADPDGGAMVWIPAGMFATGPAGGSDRETRQREVWLPGFFVAKHEVRVDQFAAFVAATGHRSAAETLGGSLVTRVETGCAGGCETASWRTPLGDGTPSPGDHPAVHVSWLDAVAYARWAGCALPSELQWERAAAWDPLTGRSRRYAWGDEPPPPGAPIPANVRDGWPAPGIEAHFEGKDGHARTAPVGSFPQGASPSGILDATGNAAEWCSDLWAGDEPITTDELTLRATRGGSWADGPQRARAQWRGRAAAGLCTDTIGFRVVKNP